MKINARKLSLRILDEIEQMHEFSHVVVGNTLSQYDIEPPDRRLTTQLVFGVLENKLLLDYYIRKLSAQRFSRIDKSVVNILRMGFYQLQFMDRIPESAAVNESVKLAKSISQANGSFVNGILRNFIRNGKKVELPNRKQHPITYMSIMYSFPEWLVEFWIEQYGILFAEKLMYSSNKTPKLSLRINTSRVTIDDFKHSLIEAGVEFSTSELVEEGLLIETINGFSVRQLPGFEEGEFAIQDISSMCVGKLAGVKEGDHILDVCAAPGGKATHVATLLNQTGKVIARDLHIDKLGLIEENATRLKLTNLVVEQFDAMILDETIIDKMDIVLVDAPCSGLGIIRRKPDIKYNKTPESLNELIPIQNEILAVSSKYVKPGGTLMYSTCTLNSHENQEVVDNFLALNPEFELENILGQNYLTLFPSVNQTDGFFIAKLRRKMTL